MKKTILFLLFLFVFASIKAQDFIFADTVSLSTRNVENVVVAETPSFPLTENSKKIGQYHLTYCYSSGVPAFLVYIEDDGSDLYQKMRTFVDDKENGYEKLLRAKRYNSTIYVKNLDITMMAVDSYTISPRFETDAKYLLFMNKEWNNDRENFDICVSIVCNAYVDTKTYKKPLQESYLLKHDIFSIKIKYGDDEISIPLYNISTSNLISRCKKLIK